MVLDSNVEYHVVNKFVCDFLRGNEDLLTRWKDKNNAKNLKNVLRRVKTVKPKRVNSKYIYFCELERPKIVAEFPHYDIRKVTVELGRRWRAFNENPDTSILTQITDKFNNDKERYCEQKSLLLKVDANSKSAYLNYCKSRRQDNPKISLKELGNEWTCLKRDNPEYLSRFCASSS